MIPLMLNVVIDTNVVVAGLLSRKGASFKILSRIGTGEFDISLSVPLLFEYEDVLKRQKFDTLDSADINNFLNYLCKMSLRRKIFYLWRPYLTDPKDDMILELGFEANCDFIVTFNQRDFKGIEKFNLQAITPQKFLSILRR